MAFVSYPLRDQPSAIKSVGWNAASQLLQVVCDPAESPNYPTACHVQRRLTGAMRRLHCKLRQIPFTPEAEADSAHDLAKLQRSGNIVMLTEVDPRLAVMLLAELPSIVCMQDTPNAWQTHVLQPGVNLKAASQEMDVATHHLGLGPLLEAMTAVVKSRGTPRARIINA